MARPRAHDQTLRRRLLARAGEMVAEGGVSALSIRGLAAAEFTSATAVGSLFGGMHGLTTALFQEAFESFGASQRAAPRTGDVLVDLLELGLAYRAWALDNPQLYRIMFGGVTADFALTDELVAASMQTLLPLGELVAQGVKQHLFVGDPMIITRSFWAAVHGAASLTLAGMPSFEEIEHELFVATLRSVMRGWLADESAMFVELPGHRPAAGETRPHA